MAENNKEPNKTEGNQQNRPVAGATGGSPTGGTPQSSGVTAGDQGGNIGGVKTTSAGSGGTAARQAPQSTSGQSLGNSYDEIKDNVTQWGSEAASQAQETFRNAYDQASQTVSQTWSQARDYGRENPGQTTMIAFAVGVGVGLLLAGNARSGSRSRRLLPPVMNALTEIADEFLR